MLMMYLALIDDPIQRGKFETLYYAYRKQMFYTANEILEDYGLAEDAVQEAFIGIARNIAAIDDTVPGMVKAYVLTAARNAARNIWNREHKAEILTLDVEQLPDTQDDEPLGLRAAVDALPLLYREVLMLRYVQGLSYEEVAAILHRPEGTVRQQVARGKKRLTELLGEECVFHGE